MTRFNTIEELVGDLKKGRMIVVLDDEDRENEGDLVVAGSLVTPAHINFMATLGRGIVCVPMTAERLDSLELFPMSPSTKDPFKTSWAISCDARRGITTGISSCDRCRTIRLLADEATRPFDLTTPGHLFPLRAQDGGVLARAGHTEACVDLMKLAHLPPIGVICEIMKDDGSMARTPDLLAFAARHHLKIGTVADLIEYRRRREKLIRRITTTTLPTPYGTFKLVTYESIIDRYHHLALVKGRPCRDGTLVRVHSECLTGDVFGSRRCDCGTQLHTALKKIDKAGAGVLVYMRQEGRGIGLANKLKAYALQDQGLDTVEANEALGFKADLRDYGIGAQILLDLGIRKIRLLTNNPKKIVGLEGYGLKVIERLPISVRPTAANRRYLETKRTKLGHHIRF